MSFIYLSILTSNVVEKDGETRDKLPCRGSKQCVNSERRRMGDAGWQAGALGQNTAKNRGLEKEVDGDKFPVAEKTNKFLTIVDV